MVVKLVKASVCDAPDIIAVQNAAFKYDFDTYGHCPSYQESLEAMEYYINERIVYKITVDRALVGDIIIKPLDSSSYYIRVLAIIPEYQNKGIGSIVFEQLFANYTDVSVWSLITPRQSVRNCHFYEKHGFKKTGEQYDSEKLTLNQYRLEI